MSESQLHLQFFTGAQKALKFIMKSSRKGLFTNTQAGPKLEKSWQTLQKGLIPWTTLA